MSAGGGELTALSCLGLTDQEGSAGMAISSEVTVVKSVMVMLSDTVTKMIANEPVTKNKACHDTCTSSLTFEVDADATHE